MKYKKFILNSLFIATSAPLVSMVVSCDTFLSKNEGDKINKPKEAKTPDTQKPDAQKPDDKKPDTQKPDDKKPDAQKPDDKKPIITDPKIIVKTINLRESEIDWTTTGFIGSGIASVQIRNHPNITIGTIKNNNNLINGSKVSVILTAAKNFQFQNGTTNKTISWTVQGLQNRLKTIVNSNVSWSASGYENNGLVSVTTNNTHFTIGTVSNNGHFSNNNTASVVITAKDGYTFSSGKTLTKTWTVKGLLIPHTANDVHPKGSTIIVDDTFWKVHKGWDWKLYQSKEKINDYHFYDFSKLTVISEGMFKQESLYKMNGWKPTLPSDTDFSNIVKIEKEGFGQMNLNPAITFPNLEEVGESGLSTVMHLGSSITFPKLKKIGNDAFRSLSSFENPRTFENLESIGNNALAGLENMPLNTKLEHIKKIGVSSFDSLKHIPKGLVFSNLVELPNFSFNSLQEISDYIIFPNVTYLGAGVFYNLKKINGYSQFPKLKEYVFNAFYQFTSAAWPDTLKSPNYDKIIKNAQMLWKSHKK